MTVPEQQMTPQEQPLKESVPQSDVAPSATQEVKEAPVESVSINEVAGSNEQYEYKRKYEELLERQPEVINEAVQKAFEQYGKKSQEQSQWSEEQLDMVIFDDTGTYNAANKAWASREKEKLRDARIEGLIQKNYNLTQEQQRNQRLAAESEQYVVATFPEMFAKDASGKVVGWNKDNPMTQLVAKYMQRPDIKGRPDALREAARQAYVDYSLSNKGAQQRQAELTASQMAQLKKQQMGAGSGSVPTATQSSEVNALYEQFKRTGRPADAAAYHRALQMSRAR